MNEREKSMKILLFGTGKIYKEKKKYISSSDEVVGFLDNNKELCGKLVDGVRVYNPNEIFEVYFDKIILMSDYAVEMKVQLLKLKCNRNKIMHYLEYIEAQSAGELLITFPLNIMSVSKNRCLIITTDLAYNGGSIAAVYAALALKRRGYDSVIAAPKCDTIFMKEIKKQGIGIIIYENLSHAKANELFWIDEFQYVVVNTLQMSCCAIEIAKSRKVILWIHEPHNLYSAMRYWKDEIQEGIARRNLKIYAVSSIARNNFMQNFNVKSVDLLPYGIPDEYSKIHKNGKLTFAMIGLVSEQKGQDIFLDAIEKLGYLKNECTFLIIGKNLQDAYGCMIFERSQKYSDVHLVGEISHEEVMMHWQDIDILVVASREDMLPIVATEAIMLGKICIISDVVGTVNYIENYSSGLIFLKENFNDLAEKMKWCIDNKKKLDIISVSARKLYESKFSMEVFGRNLEKAISK